MGIISGMSSMVTGAIGAAGDVAQGAAKFDSQIKNEKAQTDISKESKSLEAMRGAQAHQDQVSADMTKLQDEADTTKKITDTKTMVKQGQEQSWGKQMSSAASTVDGIKF